MFEHEGNIDLGDGHSIRFMSWKPDRTITGNAERYKNIRDVERAGGIITHVMPDGKLCEGSIWFDLPEVRDTFPGHSYWQVESWEPLTLSPSFLCHCGDHGFIKQGKWVRA